MDNEIDRFAFVPQLFFDLIANYVPGLALLACLAAALPEERVEAVKTITALNQTALEALGSSVAIATFALVTVGPYVLGALFGWPLHQMEQWVRGRRSPFHVPAEIRLSLKEQRKPPTEGSELFYRLPSAARERIQREDQHASQLLLFEWYDYLRLHHPEVGALAAKLRAEMMMYGGLALAIATGFIVHLVAYGGGANGWLLTVFVMLFCLALLRWWDHSWTWQFAVANFYSHVKLTATPGEPDERRMSS